MNIYKLLDIIEKHFPHDAAMEGDRIGLQLQSGNENILKLLITYELDENVITQAIENKANCIISFHPLIFYPITQITDNDRVGKLTNLLIQNKISLITIHTNFDAHHNGTNKLFSDMLGLEFESHLIPNIHRQGFGMGIVCKPILPIELSDLVKNVSELCCSPLRYCNGKPNHKIERIGIVCGSGADFLDLCLEQNLCAFITADTKYHNYHKANNRLALIDPGHFEMEQFVANGIYRILKKDLSDLEEIIISNIYTNPVRYFPDEHYKMRQMNNIINLSQVN